MGEVIKLVPEEVAELARRQSDVTGVWSILKGGANGSRAIVIEKGEKVEEILFEEGGVVKKFSGKLQPRRYNYGNPVRRLYFVSDNGNEETLLREGEF